MLRQTFVGWAKVAECKRKGQEKEGKGGADIKSLDLVVIAF